MINLSKQPRYKKLTLVGKPRNILGQLISFCMVYGNMRVTDVISDWEIVNRGEE